MSIEGSKKSDCLNCLQDRNKSSCWREVTVRGGLSGYSLSSKNLTIMSSQTIYYDIKNSMVISLKIIEGTDILFLHTSIFVPFCLLLLLSFFPSPVFLSSASPFPLLSYHSSPFAWLAFVSFK